MREEHGISIRQGCEAVGLAQSTYHYKAKPKDDSEVIDALNALVAKHPAIGFWQAFHRLRLAGRPWNHKRVYRIYTAMGLNIRRRAKKRLPARAKQHLLQPEAPNQVWSLDYVHDSLWNGRTYRLLNIIDDFNREVLRIEADTCLPAKRVIRVLEELEERRGLPEMLRVDNGPEFISHRPRACGVKSAASPWPSSNPASQHRTPSWNASTAASGASCSTLTSSAPWMKSGPGRRSGNTTTTTADLTNRWAICHRRHCSQTTSQPPKPSNTGCSK